MAQQLATYKQVGERLDRGVLLAAKYLVQRCRRPRARLNTVQTLFVAGVQRSGTNMIMDALERSYQTEVFHERDPRAFDNYQLRDETTIAKLINDAYAEVVVVKCLMESQRLRQLLDGFAPAKALWVFRNPHDVVNSMLASFGNQALQVERIARDRHAGGWLSENMTEATHQRVQRLAAKPLDNQSAAAVQWYFRNMAFFDQGLNNDAGVLLVNYDTLVRNPDSEFAKIFRFLSIKFSTRIVGDVSAVSIGRRRPPQLRDDVEALCQEMHQRLLRSITA